MQHQYALSEMMKSKLIGEVLEKRIPRKRSVFGGLASPARFERAAFRLGVVFRQSINYALKR